MATKYVPELIAESLARYYKEGLTSLFAQGQKIQEAVLQDIMALSKGSQYAKDHGFDDVDTKEAFCEKVPLSEYGDYYPYIRTNMEKDDHQVIDLETDHYLLSTGRERQVKY